VEEERRVRGRTEEREVEREREREREREKERENTKNFVPHPISIIVSSILFN
jgi:hypothetical protein